MDTCPTCGQRMLMRYGVRLTPREADLFDLINSSANQGVDIEVLGWSWAGRERTLKAQRALVKTTIFQINNKIEAAHYRIRGSGTRPAVYRLIRW